MQGNQSRSVTVASHPVVLLLGPSRKAISGVSTHLNLLFASSLVAEFALRHFQVGSEGRRESALTRLLRLLLGPIALGWRVVREDVAVVHINTSLNRAFWRDLGFLVMARLCGARVVYQVHGGALPRDFCRSSRLPESVLRAVLKLPEAIVVLAQSELAAYRQFLPGHPVLVLPNGIDCAPYAWLKRRIPDRAAALKLVYIGRLASDKGLFEALEALAMVLGRGVEAELTIAGDGPEVAALQARAETLGIASKVRFAGPVFGGAKRHLLADSDVLVLPTYAEGLPYALLEAMAAGVPAVTTPVGGIPDVVNEGEHGLLVPPRDAQAVAAAIETLARDRARLERMRRACTYRIVTSYSLSSLAKSFGRLYRDMCFGRAVALGNP